MKALLATLLVAAAPALALAQASPAPSKPAAKAAAKSATVKKRGGKVVPKTAEEKIEVDDDPAVNLTPADLEVAKKVYVGDIPCELGATVHITPHKREGFFIVRTGIQRFRMHPVESKTGAIRLEDPVARGHVAAAGQQVHADEPEDGQAPGRRMHEPRAGRGGRSPEDEPHAQPAGAAARGCRRIRRLRQRHRNRGSARHAASR